MLGRILKEIQYLSGCESVAIRLYKDNDFPYYLQVNFPDFFIVNENSLNVKEGDGSLLLDADGTPFVECMCGNVLKRRFNPELRFFTEKGSFWTNSTTQLLSTLTESERQQVGKTRNTCHNFGYESVALVPLVGKEGNQGLIQINDPRENMFTLGKIRQYELIAEHISEVIDNLHKATYQVFQIIDMVSKFKNVAVRS